VFKSNSYCYYILTLFYQSLRTLPLPSLEVLRYTRDILAVNTAGTELLPELPDVAIQDYTIPANLEPQPSQVRVITANWLKKSSDITSA